METTQSLLGVFQADLVIISWPAGFPLALIEYCPKLYGCQTGEMANSVEAQACGIVPSQPQGPRLQNLQ